MVQGSGLKVPGLGFSVQGSGFSRIWGFGGYGWSVRTTGAVIHARPFVGASPCRSWSHFVVLGAILWAFWPKGDKFFCKSTFEIPPRRALRGL